MGNQDEKLFPKIGTAILDRLSDFFSEMVTHRTLSHFQSAAGLIVNPPAKTQYTYEIYSKRDRIRDSFIDTIKKTGNSKRIAKFIQELFDPVYHRSEIEYKELNSILGGVNWKFYSGQRKIQISKRGSGLPTPDPKEVQIKSKMEKLENELVTYAEFNSLGAELQDLTLECIESHLKVLYDFVDNNTTLYSSYHNYIKHNSKLVNQIEIDVFHPWLLDRINYSDHERQNRKSKVDFLYKRIIPCEAKVGRTFGYDQYITQFIEYTTMFPILIIPFLIREKQNHFNFENSISIISKSGRIFIFFKFFL